MKSIYDVVIVGSGPSGVHTAYPLVNGGLKVAMIDGGLDSTSSLEKTDQLLKINSNIEVTQSLAKGGLSEIWPGICDYFSKEELIKIGLPINEIIKEYPVVSNLIRLKLKPNLDIQGKSILNSRQDVYQLPLAFPYRTSLIIDEFKKYKNFTYIPNQLVLKVNDNKKLIEIRNLSINNLKASSVQARSLILAAGSINTTRILLRSFSLYNKKVPFLTKGNYMIVCLLPKILLKKVKAKITHPGQIAISDNDHFIQFYKGNPNSFNKALPFIPLPKFLAVVSFKVFAPFLVIADVRFTTLPGKSKFYRLNKTLIGDTLEISFHQTKTELQKQKIEIKNIKNKLISIGLIPFKILKGSVTYHYAGGVPIKDTPGILSCDSNGKLHQAKRIYIADSSTWRILPAKPPTLTIMANARRIGKHVLTKFQ